MEKQRKVFLSYSRFSTDFAIRLARELKVDGFNVWLDQLDIPAGARWDREVEKALKEREIFMIIMTPAAIASENVSDEIAYAIDKHKHMLPVLLEKCEIPFRLRRFQYVDFTNKNFEEGLEYAKALLRSLNAQPTDPQSKLSQNQQNEITETEADAQHKEHEKNSRVRTPETNQQHVTKNELNNEPLKKDPAIAAHKPRGNIEAGSPARDTQNNTETTNTQRPITSRASRTSMSIVMMVAAGVVAIFMILAVGGLFAILRGLSNQVPDPTVTQTRTQRPTSTPEPRPTFTPNFSETQQAKEFAATIESAEALAAQASRWNVKLSETFLDNRNRWLIGVTNSDLGRTEAKVVAGKYQFSLSSDTGVFSRSWAYTTSLTNFYLKVDAEETGESVNGQYGVVFRNTEGNDYYYFGVYPNQGTYSFDLYYDGKWERLIEPTPSSIIYSDRPNTLTLVARGSHFVFFINDQFVAEKTDDTLSNGPIGLSAGISENESSMFEFDNLELRVPAN